jgi:glycerol-3-phosphate cytidylyltransferase-like family protein
VQDIVVASESDGTAPGGNERVRDEVGRCEEDNAVESCDQVDSNTSEDDIRDVEEHVVDEVAEGGTSNDDEDDRVDSFRDTGGS